MFYAIGCFIDSLKNGTYMQIILVPRKIAYLGLTNTAELAIFLSMPIVQVMLKIFVPQL